MYPDIYTLTLDDDPMIHAIIAAAMGVPSLSFTHPDALRRALPELDPIALFIDINLEADVSGLDLIPELRKRWPSCPLLVVTSDPSDDALGGALAAGANDFIRKPINRNELLARVKARMTEMARQAGSTQLVLGPLTFNRLHRSLEYRRERRYLTPQGACLLECLIEAQGMAVPRVDLKRRIWSNVKIGDNALDKKVHELRSALRELTADIHVQAIYGVGLSIRYQPTGTEIEVER